MFCKNCGAKTNVRKTRCPVCGADQRKRRLSFFSLLAVALACAMFAGVLTFGYVLHKGSPAALTQPDAYTAQPTAETDAETVYVTHAGTKYHKDGCTHLNDTKLKLSRAEAIRQGYEPCAVCFPEEETTP